MQSCDRQTDTARRQKPLYAERRAGKKLIEVASTVLCALQGLHIL